ncbi:MAG: hypothetical protein NVV73_02415 [Cellvibrionaceae bacterium]|nr:hypothetical protein [Cellvibrionaceae bacterium]
MSNPSGVMGGARVYLSGCLWYSEYSRHCYGFASSDFISEYDAVIAIFQLRFPRRRKTKIALHIAYGIALFCLSLYEMHSVISTRHFAPDASRAAFLRA